MKEEDAEGSNRNIKKSQDGWREESKVDSDLSLAALKFEFDAAKQEPYATMKEGAKRVFVTSRHMKSDELRILIPDFEMYKTGASGQWGRVTNGCFPPDEPPIKICTEVYAHCAMLFIARHDTCMSKIVDVLR